MIEILDTDDTDKLDGRHGACTLAYARQRLGDQRLRAALETGALISFGRGVFMDARRVLDLRTRSAGAQLLTGGTIVGPTAVALHGSSAVGGYPIHVRVPYDQRIRSRTGMIVHQGGIRGSDTTVLDGLRVLTATAAVADALCTEPRRAALAGADELLHALRPDDRAGFVASVAEHLATRVDRRGTRRARELLILATGLPECPAQSALLLILTDAGFARPTCQHEVARHRFDFAWPNHNVALEYVGHQTKEQRHDHRVHVPGWHVIRADAHDLAEPTMLCTRLRTALRARRPIAA